jgi:hypothetical protein
MLTAEKRRVLMEYGILGKAEIPLDILTQVRGKIANIRMNSHDRMSTFQEFHSSLSAEDFKKL